MFLSQLLKSNAAIFGLKYDGLHLNSYKQQRRYSLCGGRGPLPQRRCERHLPPVRGAAGAGSGSGGGGIRVGVVEAFASYFLPCKSNSPGIAVQEKEGPPPPWIP